MKGVYLVAGDNTKTGKDAFVLVDADNRIHAYFKAEQWGIIGKYIFSPSQVRESDLKNK